MSKIKKELEQLNDAEKTALNILDDVTHNYHSKAQKRLNRIKKMRRKFEKRRNNSI